MSRPYIADEIRVSVAVAAKDRCGYCLTQAHVIGEAMNLDHIIPVLLGGLSEESNLWLACSRCNRYKSAKVSATDPQSGAVVSLFDPRRQKWAEHFAWTSDGITVVGLTAIGRAKVEALQINNPRIVKSRKLWVAAGWHPPQD